MAAALNSRRSRSREGRLSSSRLGRYSFPFIPVQFLLEMQLKQQNELLAATPVLVTYFSTLPIAATAASDTRYCIQNTLSAGVPAIVSFFGKAIARRGFNFNYGISWRQL